MLLIKQKPLINLVLSYFLKNWNYSVLKGYLLFYKMYLKWVQKQPSRGAFKKSCSEKVEQLYWNRTSAWVFSCKFAAYFQNTFSKEQVWTAAFMSKYSEKSSLWKPNNFLKSILKPNSDKPVWILPCPQKPICKNNYSP